MPRKANPNRPEYAKLIAEAREGLNLSQQQLGQLIGRDTATVKKYEGGKILPPFFVLMKIADQLSLDKKYLANLVMKEDSAVNWLDTAFEEIAWIFNLIQTGIDYQNNSENIHIHQHLRKKSCKKLDFLFEISNILRLAQNEYKNIIGAKTDSFVNDVLSGSRPDLEIK